MNLSSQCQIRGDLAGAIKWRLKAIEFATQSEAIEAAQLYNGLADLYYKSENLVQAEAAARHSIRFELEFGDCGKTNSNLASYYMMLGKLLATQERFGDALVSVDSGIAIFELYYDAQDPFLTNIKAFREELKRNCWRG